MKKTILITLFFFLNLCLSLANTGIIESKKLNIGYYCIIYLNNGDIISGEVSEFIDDKEYGLGLKIDSDLGKAIIYEEQIKDIRTGSNYYRYQNRSLLLPTAYPIENDHFAGLTELALVNAGFGITKYFSIMGAHSILPATNYDSQVFYINAKATIFNDIIDNRLGKFAIATGVNFARIGKGSQMWHAFLGASLDFGTTIISSNLFYKFKGGDIYDYRFNSYLWTYPFMDGAFGITLALDKELSEKGPHLFVEVINGDINNYKQTSVLTGMRFSNNRFAADVGLGLIGGFPLPIMQFFWTPF